MTNCLARGVHHEISDGHFTSGDKSGQARQKTKRNHQSADEFDDSSHQHQTRHASVPAARKAEKLLAAVTGKHKSNYQSHDAVDRVRKSIQRVHGRSG